MRWFASSPDRHPPETALAEYYEVPWNNSKAPAQGFAPRGMDVDSKGVVWAPLSSGHYASFDRRKCKGRSTDRPPPRDSTARKAGRSIRSRAELQGSRGQRQRRLGVLQLR